MKGLLEKMSERQLEQFIKQTDATVRVDQSNLALARRILKKRKKVTGGVK